MRTVLELLRFFARRKKYWLIPVVTIMIVIGAILIFAQGSVVAPLIYTLF
ncbi:MAG: DUF5989 family protein [Pseudomonadota bacterium]